MSRGQGFSHSKPRNAFIRTPVNPFPTPLCTTVLQPFKALAQTSKGDHEGAGHDQYNVLGILGTFEVYYSYIKNIGPRHWLALRCLQYKPCGDSPRCFRNVSPSNGAARISGRIPADSMARSL